MDVGYVSADLLAHSQAEYPIDLIGPARGNPTWQNKIEGAYTGDQFTIDWAGRVVHCPQGVASAAWHDYIDKKGKPYHVINFSKTAQGVQRTPPKTLQQPRRLSLHPQPQQEVLRAARQ